MSLSTYAGAGTTFSSDYYMRNYYSSNRDARTSHRSEFMKSELSLADSMALHKAVKALGKFKYNDDQDINIRSSVSAYISTYNNILSSSAASDDSDITRSTKHLTSLTSEYSKQLDKIGITVNKDGSLTMRDSLFKESDLSKFEALFSDDSEYMKKTTTYIKQIEDRSEALYYTDRIAQSTSHTASPSDKSTSSAGSTAAALVSEALDLDVLLNTGIGSHINISL